MSTPGGRFTVSQEFVPSLYGDGYWRVCVTDTLTGNETSGTVFEANALDSTAKSLASSLVATASAELEGPKTYRFDLPGQEEDEGATDTPSEDALEGE